MNKNIELTKEEEQTILDTNKYLNIKFDISEILAFGNIPEFENTADKFLCVNQVALFIHKNGLGNQDYLLKFLELLPADLLLLFFKQQNTKTIEVMSAGKFRHLIDKSGYNND